MRSNAYPEGSGTRVPLTANVPMSGIPVEPVDVHEPPSFRLNAIAFPMLQPRPESSSVDSVTFQLGVPTKDDDAPTTHYRVWGANTSPVAV